MLEIRKVQIWGVGCLAHILTYNRYIFSHFCTLVHNKEFDLTSFLANYFCELCQKFDHKEATLVIPTGTEEKKMNSGVWEKFQSDAVRAPMLGFQDWPKGNYYQ